MDIQITDLDALKAAASDLGLEFREGQRAYRWYGSYQGDYPLPKGVKKNDLGKCDHALSVPDNPTAYEVGVVHDGNHYQLCWDFWNGGHGLQDLIGEGGHKLLQKYTEKVVEKSLAKKGFRTTSRTVAADGTVQIKLRR